MSETKLCDCCQALLQGNLIKTDSTRLSYWHHKTASSFEAAEKLGCDICVRLSAIFLREYWYQTQDPRPCTVEYTTTHFDSKAKSAEYLPYVAITFSCAATGSKSLVKEYYLDARMLFKPCGDGLSHVDQLDVRSTGDDHSLAYLKDQYDHCLALHDKCADSTGFSLFLPKRLIDVGAIGDSAVRLRKNTEILAGTPYVVLSHCWGGIQPLTLTHDTAQELFHWVHESRLPLTFQHAVAVTREFGIRYLWIDSLCIRQDDLADWHTQAELMGNVYRNSTFCIAATAAQNGNDGLFYDMELRSRFLVNVHIKRALFWKSKSFLPSGKYKCSVHPMYADRTIEFAPLNRRAWVAQERYLSRRILHFARGELFWECQESFTCESHPELNDKYYHNELYGTGLKKAVSLARSEPFMLATDVQACKDRIYSHWIHFRTMYSCSGMTKESDILIALRGVALDVAKILDDKIVFGLWQNRLLSELNWFVPELESCLKCRPTSWRAPSWSWASSTQPILKAFDFLNSGQVIQYAELLGMPIESYDPASWKLYCVPMRCRLISLRLAYNEDKATKTPMSVTFNNIHVYHTYGITTQFDDRDQKIRQGYFLLLQRYGKDDVCQLQGLIIVPDTRHPASYKRIGWMHVKNIAGHYVETYIVSWLGTWVEPQHAASAVLKLHETLQDQEIRLI